VGAISAVYGFQTVIALPYNPDIAALLLLIPEQKGAELA